MGGQISETWNLKKWNFENETGKSVHKISDKVIIEVFWSGPIMLDIFFFQISSRLVK